MRRSSEVQPSLPFAKRSRAEILEACNLCFLLIFSLSHLPCDNRTIPLYEVWQDASAKPGQKGPKPLKTYTINPGLEITTINLIPPPERLSVSVRRTGKLWCEDVSHRCQRLRRQQAVCQDPPCMHHGGAPGGTLTQRPAGSSRRSLHASLWFLPITAPKARDQRC